MRLRRIFQEQKRFQKHFYNIDNLSEEEKIKRTKEFILSVHRELGEVLNVIPWKIHRKNSKKYNVKEIREELIDCIKFLLNLCIIWGINDNEFEKLFFYKSAIVEKRFQKEKKDISDFQIKKHIVVSGYFNPLHKGHLKMIENAKKLGFFLTVIVNNDKQVKAKGSIPFMNEKERINIVSALKDVDRVILSIDKDKSVSKTLEMIKPDIFANGGDRKTTSDIPEKEICKKLNIEMIFNTGGKKIQSSSTLLNNIK